MKSKTKKTLIFCLIALVIIGIVAVIIAIAMGGSRGDGWYDTPKEAITKKSKDKSINTEELTVKVPLDTQSVDNIANVLYLSASDKVVLAICEKNDDGKWTYREHFVDDVSAPSVFIMNGDVEQQLTEPYRTSKDLSMVYGWKYTKSPKITVNCEATQRKTYIFNINGEEWSIDYWWTDKISANSIEEINVTYVTE